MSDSHAAQRVRLAAVWELAAQPIVTGKQMFMNSTKDKLENETPHFGNTMLWAVAV